MLLEGCIKARLNIDHLRRHRLGQNDAAQHAVELHLATPTASSRSKTRPNCSCSRSTWCGWKRGRRTSKARARSRPPTWSAMPCVCGPSASSSANAAVPETLDMLQAMNTGHDGSLTTIHANTPARRPGPLGNDDHDGRLRTAASKPCGSRSPAPSTCSFKPIACRAVRAG